jgi:predicted phosphodiesterase
MNTNRIAILSDIHGNSFALKEVLEDIKNQKIETILNLGDSLDGPLDIKGTFELIIENNIESIAGNGERLILKNLYNETENLSFEQTKKQLDSNIIEWYKLLPFAINFEDKLYGCHGSPHSDMEYLLEGLNDSQVYIKASSELDKILKEIDCNIVVCGHSHVSRVVKTNTKTIINVGSVGLPAYDDDLPIFHVMENHTPDAQYTILDFSEYRLKIDQKFIPYEFEAAAQLAENNSRKDWAKWLRTGRN